MCPLDRLILQVNSGAPATNRIATATNDQGTVGLSYDAAGNLTQDGSAVYNYDAANRLKEVGVGGSNTYGYDGDGMRVRQSSGGAAMFYVRSSVLKNVAMEVTATGGAVRAYVQAGNKTVAMSSRDGQFYWLHTNHLNSSRAMTDINGTLVYKGQYDPYGKALLEWSATNDTGLNSRKFTGYERDATGLDYANARTYASERGRFLQPDKLGLGAANANRPQSFNRYTYTGNDPINFVDPTGLDEEPFTIRIATLEPHAQPAGPRGDLFDGSFLPEDSNSGEIGFQDPYTSLTRDEKLLCISYPAACSKVARARDEALQERQRRYGDTGGNDDWCDNAFLHAYWNARMVQLLSLLPNDPFLLGFTAVEMAKAFADAHEARPNNPDVEKRMDFWNNNVGRIIATQNPNATPEQLADLIQNEVNAGRVLVMDGNGAEPRHPHPGECDPND